MRVLYWIALIAGVLAVLWIAFASPTKTQAPLNASGYTYPSTPGA